MYKSENCGPTGNSPPPKTNAEVTNRQRQGARKNKGTEKQPSNMAVLAITVNSPSDLGTGPSLSYAPRVANAMTTILVTIPKGGLIVR